MAGSFQDDYPNITHWVKKHGWIEIGQNGYLKSFVSALDEGGMVWEEKTKYRTLEEAFQALDTGLAEWLGHNR